VGLSPWQDPNRRLPGHALQGDVRGSTRTQTLGAAVLLVLVALPLIWIIGRALQPALPREQKALPLVPANQARALPSYGSPCLQPEACAPPLGCLEIGETGRGICLNTECETNADCNPGEYCRTLATMGNGPPLRGCDLREGERFAGEPCDKGLTVATTDRCAPGLLCNRGWCGQPCSLGEDAGCPAGFFCQQGLDGPSCVPTCEAQGCPQGLQCAREAGGISVCAQLRGNECSSGACPEGSRCTFTHLSSVDAGLALRLECIPSCGQREPACPSGRACIASRCLRTCDPQGPDTCYAEERCIYRVDLGIALCKQPR
jgi:hypothetical protein